MSALDRWLEDRIRPPQRLGERVWVLCRTWASVSMIRRWAARRGGLPGIVIGTPETLANQLHRPALLSPIAEPPQPTGLPTDCPIAARIGDRPGLIAVARGWARWLRLARAVGHPAPAPGWLEALSGWGIDTPERALIALLGRLQHPGGLGSLGRIVPLGFEAPAGVAPPWERALADALGIGSAPAPAARTLPAHTVPDVVAEARLAAAQAARAPLETVILVATSSTARRVRDALHRNGLPCAWRDRLPLRTHPLASAVERCAAWLSGPDPQIQADDLSWILCRVLAARPHPAAATLLSHRLAAHGLSGEPIQLLEPRVRALLGATGLRGAPLRRWLAELDELSTPGPQIPAPRAALASAIWVRLWLLERTCRGQPIEPPGGPLAAADHDGFEWWLADRLGEERPAAPPPPGTLAALRAWLVACRLELHDDPGALSILAALGRHARLPATPRHAAHALRGIFDPGQLEDGVQLVRYAEWDGRPAGQLLLLDLHDGGITRRPPPDPLLSTAQIEALGGPGRDTLVAHRLAAARRAAAAADHVMALICERGAGGRPAVPPVGLCRPAARAPVPIPSYGLGLPRLPEERDRGRLIRLTSTADRPEHTDPWLDHLAIQACAEWHRQGQGPLQRPTHLGSHATLAELLEADAPGPPGWLSPYLGDASGIPGATLPDAPLGVTGLLSVASRCLFQAYATHVLGLHPPEPPSDALDPPQIRRAIHDALQRASQAVRWRSDEATGAEATLVASLQAESLEAFEAWLSSQPALSEARLASAIGQLMRWNRHWPSFAASRLQPRQGEARLRELDQLKDHPAFRKAFSTVRHLAPSAHNVPNGLLCGWLLEVLREPPERFLARSEQQQLSVWGRRRLPGAMLASMEAVIHHPDVRGLSTVLRNLRWRAAALSAPVEAVASGLSLGPVALPLGASEVEIQGEIDRVMAIPSRHGPLLELTDYRTDAPAPGWRFRRSLHQLSEPQLLVYALVLHHLQGRHDLPEPFRGARVASVAWDHVRNTYREPQRRQQPDLPQTTLLVDTEVLERTRAALGAVLDRARSGIWSLRPRPETCPALIAHGHDRCPFVGACRLRGLPT